MRNQRQSIATAPFGGELPAARLHLRRPAQFD
jgi:hypothetical protein